MALYIANQSVFSRLRTLAFCVACCGAMTSISTSAFAQNKELAESLFGEGRKAMDAGNFAQACDLFSKSQKADPAVGTLLNLGECNAKQDKYASAWASYKEAASLAKTRNDFEREKQANDQALAVEGKRSFLKVSTKAPVTGLVVKVDGTESVLDIPLPADPGKHKVELSAPGFKTAVREVVVGASGDKQEAVFDALEEGSDAGPGPGPGPGVPGPVGSAGAEEGSGGTLMVVGFITAGVGAAALVVGGVTGGIASSTVSGAEEDPALCPNKVCTPAGRAEIDSAEGLAGASTGTFIAGGVLAAAGVVLIVVGATSGGSSASDEAPPAAALSFSPAVGPNFQGAFLSGSFF